MVERLIGFPVSFLFAQSDEGGMANRLRDPMLPLGTPPHQSNP
jgi:hypothetical protein